MRKNTLDLLENFHDAGGHIIAVKPVPYMIEGETSQSLECFFENKCIIIDSGHENWFRKIEKLLYELSGKPVEITSKKPEDAHSIICHYRKMKNNDVCFLANTSLKRVNINVQINKTDSLQKSDGSNRVIFPANNIKGTGTVFPLEFSPAQSHIITIAYGKVSVPGYCRKKIKEVLLPEQWSFNRKDPNVLLLYKCQYLQKNGKWSKLLNIWDIQKALTDGYVEPVHLKLKFIFHVSGAIKSNYDLLAESPADMEIALNDHKVRNISKDWFIDINFKRISMDKYVKKGKNNLIIDLKWDANRELEPVYVIGTFAVEVPSGKIIAEKQKIDAGSWAMQGYPYYAGTISYQTTANIEINSNYEIYLELKKMRDVVKVIINGADAGVLAWPPYKFDVTPIFKKWEQ